MAQSAPQFENFSLAPLGAGDLIDRSIRLYRQHFLTLLRIAAPPVMVSAAGSVMYAIGMRGAWSTSDNVSFAVFITLLITGAALIWSGLLFQVIVMGGATRNLVSNMLWNEPVSARSTYRNVRHRFWGLLLSSLILAVAIVFCGFIIIVVFYFSIAIVALGAIAMAQVFPAWAVVVFSVLLGAAVIIFLLALFFFLMGHFAYLPQVMLVEGRGVFDSIGRSFTLAHGNTRRLMAMFSFSWLATYSALMVLAVPIGLYAYLRGINPVFFSYTGTPAWYSITYTVLGQLSSIIIAPVWMLGLSLLYVDDRVRKEGYDIELMSARRLGPIPQQIIVPESAYTPALSSQPGERPASQAADNRHSVLGLR